MSDQASQAERLVNDPLLQQAFENYREAAITAWISTKADDAKAREVAWLTIKVIDRVQAELQAVIDNGKIAAARVQRPIGSN